MHTMSRIVAIESDPDRIRMIRALVDEWTNAELTVVESADAIERVIEDEQPELILTSTVTPPAVEARLMSIVRDQPHSSHIPVLTLPPLTDAPVVTLAPKRSSILSLFGPRSQPAPFVWQHYDSEALGQRIRESLEQSIEERAWYASRERLWAEAAAAQVQPQFLVPVEPLHRAPRVSRQDVSWLSAVKLSWGMEVQVLNISRSGMLIESGTRFNEGAREEFELHGMARRVMAAARFVRTRVTQAEGISVRYQAAAAFESEIPLLLEQPIAHAPMPFTQAPMAFTHPIDAPAPLADVMAWVREEAGRGVDPSHLLAAYELELQHLVRAREVRICETPDIDGGSGDSVFFSVPIGGADTVLRATFDPGRKPGLGALELLKQAALLAPDVVRLDLARLS
jgi:CheY-like chemotaxis protein